MPEQYKDVTILSAMTGDTRMFLVGKDWIIAQRI